MKSNYEISIVCNDLFKNESLYQAITNLEKLDQITVDVFNRINKSLIDKKTKLENLKSRINRANLIISNFENLPQALTLKSKRFYPTQGSNNENTNNNMDISIRSNVNSSFAYQSIYYDDVCDFALVKIPSTKNHQDINTKPSNPSTKLGKRPDGMLEDVSLYQDILNTIQEYKEITNDIKFSSKNPTPKSLDYRDMPPETEKLNSIFQFMEKAKVYGDKKNTHHEPRNSNLINSFLKKTNQLMLIKKPQEAPVSITEKIKLTKYKQKKDLIRRNTTNNIQLNIPKNINLPLISDFDIETTPLEDYFAEDNESEVDAPQEAIFNDDINEFQTPLDIIKNYNNKQSQLFYTGSDVANHSNTRTATENKTANNLSQNNQTYTTPNKQTNNSQVPDSNVTNPNQQQNQKTNTPTAQFKNQPVTPSINTIKPDVQVPVTGQSKSSIPPAPKIPIPPPIAKLPAIPLKKTNDTKPKPSENKTGEVKSFLDEIACENPMARLKKIGTVNVNNTKDGKKEEKAAPRQSSMLDLLKQQIGLRFNKLNKDTKPVKKKKKKKMSDDSGSFSSKNNSESE